MVYLDPLFGGAFLQLAKLGLKNAFSCFEGFEKVAREVCFEPKQPGPTA